MFANSKESSVKINLYRFVGTLSEQVDLIHYCKAFNQIDVEPYCIQELSSTSQINVGPVLMIINGEDLVFMFSCTLQTCFNIFFLVGFNAPSCTRCCVK